MGYTDAKVEMANTTLSQSKGLTDGIQNGGRIIVKGVEDLGGGLSATANLEWSISPSTAANSFANRQSHLTVAGGFGSVTLGRVYSLHHSNQGAGDLVGNVSNAGYIGGMDSLVRASNAIVYTAPSFGGVTVAVELLTDPSAAAPGAAKTDGNGIRVSYAEGALAAGFVQENMDNYTADFSKLGGAVVDATLTGTVEKRTARSLFASYDLGVAKVGLVSNNTSYDTLKWTANTVSVSAPMGVVTLLGSMGNGQLKDGADKFKLSAYQLGAKYDLSKRTNLYFYTGQTKIKEINAKFNQTSLGIKHSF